jgi:hypothetical protein
MAMEFLDLPIIKNVAFVVPLLVLLHYFVGLEDLRTVGALHGEI